MSNCPCRYEGGSPLGHHTRLTGFIHRGVRFPSPRFPTFLYSSPDSISSRLSVCTQPLYSPIPAFLALRPGRKDILHIGVEAISLCVIYCLFFTA